MGLGLGFLVLICIIISIIVITIIKCKPKSKQPTNVQLTTASRYTQGVVGTANNTSFSNIRSNAPPIPSASTRTTLNQPAAGRAHTDPDDLNDILMQIQMSEIINNSDILYHRNLEQVHSTTPQATNSTVSPRPNTNTTPINNNNNNNDRSNANPRMLPRHPLGDENPPDYNQIY